MMPKQVERFPDRGELVARVGEILEACAPAERRDEVIAEALARAGHVAIPETPEELLFFATGALYEVAQGAWGSEVADAVLLGLSPVLDRAWERDRHELLAEGTPSRQPGSGVRRRSNVHRRSNEQAAILEEGDTIPAPPPDPSDRPSDDAPSSSGARQAPGGRITVPYTQVAFSEPHAAARILILAADDATRARLAQALRGQPYAVATASHRSAARALFARLAPEVLVADLETLAPDFEPLRPALEELFGTSPPAKVVLVSDAPLREKAEAVAAVVPFSASPESLARVVTPLLERS